MEDGVSRSWETVGAFEAKTNFSKLLKRVRDGVVIRITHRGVVVAELRKASEERAPVRLGTLEGQIRMEDDFDEPLDDFREYME